jgi:polysaccharide export outer membrane protein
VPITRLTESRRILLLSSTRALQAAAQIEQLERERDELGRRVQKLTDQRRIDIMRELQDVGVKAASLRAKLQSTGERLVYSGALRSQFVRGRDGEAASEIVVRRRENGEAKTIQADDNLDLHPGDVIEVTLRLSDVMGAGASLKP